MTPLRRTIAPATNPAPFTVIVKPGIDGSPARTDGGDSAPMNGFTVRLTEFEVPPPGAGLTTVTGKELTTSRLAAGNVAVSCVGLTKTVARLVGLAPPKWTTDPATKFVPVIVTTWSRLPAAKLVGVTVVIVGTGTLVTVRSTKFEVPPPGNGLKTVIGKVPTAATSAARIWAVI